ncbi:hypothetical protein Glove_110g21 [Diversispora epigaea]|uniref:Uncharacterized protein n=1 Tax=Diversispora epigaea TaxID=1348612 RepID=A0A397JBY7_9GLOM|nr:hypothetical protein Glove_110g21 [Diversispora epigaea]
MTKKLLGQCAACNLEKPEERYRYISNYALEKALIGTAYKICCPEIKVGTLLCNTYQPNNKKKRIILSLEEYQKFVENSKSVEELKIKIQETKIQLEIVTKPISADNNTFVQFFNDKIQHLATVLYNHQHREGNKPVLDVDEFTDLIESRDSNLCGFFNLIFQSMNPNAKGRQTKESLKRKVMLLCYQMAALRNKQVSGTKNVIGLYMAGTGMSTVGINTLSNMGLSATYQTVYNNKKQIANVYEQTIQEYISDNQQKLLILNIDDYHDLHESRIPSVTSINRISHMATILLNTNNISPIPLSSAFHNPNGIDDNTQKSNWNSIKDVTTLNEFDLVETLVVHCYDADLSEKHVRRFDTTKLVDFIPSDLKNMNDYIKALTKAFSLFEMRLYLMNYIIPVPADFPGQLYIRRAIVQKLKYGNQCSIPKEVLSLVPILDPLHVSLNTRENVTTLNEFDLVETLVVHCYDADLSEKHVRRFDTTKLVDFIPSDLKNMNDYIKALTKAFSLFEMRLYLMNYIIPVPADFPGQLYIRRAIVQKLKYGNQCSIPKEVLSLVPILDPLHVSLNTRESCFLTFHPFFNELYKEVFGKKKNLAAKPKPWRINLLLYLAHTGWSTIKSYIFARFKHSKDLGYCTFVDLLDNLIPATLDIYTILFQGNNFNQYIETIFRLWTVMRRFGRKNYDKIMLALISDVQYWTSIQHPIINTLRNNLWTFDEYPVENFHSLVRRYTSGKVTCGEWLRRDAMFIDYHRNDNQFAQSFAPKRSYPYTKKKLDLMTKRTAIFFLQFFEKLWINHGKAEKKMEGARIKKPYYYFPPLSKRFPFGAIPLGYHSSHLPNQNKFCDYENCDFIFNTNGIVLICEYAYHEECFDRIGLKCQYCFDYLSASIDELTPSGIKYKRSSASKIHRSIASYEHHLRSYSVLNMPFYVLERTVLRPRTPLYNSGCHSFNERLKMNIDIENEFDQMHVLSSEDDNSLDQAEIIKENNDMDRELADKITEFTSNMNSTLLDTNIFINITPLYNSGCHSFNERLKMNIDIENEFDQMHVLSSEDDNSLDQAEIIKENNDMDRELADKITEFTSNMNSTLLDTNIFINM